MEFVINLHSIIDSDGICNWFAINYQFHMKLVIQITNSKEMLLIDSEEINKF